MKFLFIINFGSGLHSILLVAIYSGIFIIDIHEIIAHSVEWHNFPRLNNSSFYVLSSTGAEHKISIDMTRKPKIEQNNSQAKTSVKSRKSSVNKKQPWLTNNNTSIRYTVEEQAIKYRSKVMKRAVGLTIGNHSVSWSESNSLSPTDCGLSSSKYIVGGHTAKESAHPWMALLQAGNKFSGCSGSIINEWWMVTAAHCFIDDNGNAFNREHMSIRVGSIDRTEGQVYNVQNIIVHSSYNINGFKSFDIAIVKVDDPIKMSPTVRPVCLPQQSFQDVRRSKLIVAGWGRLIFGGASTPVLLREVALNVIPLEMCAQIYVRLANRNKIYRSQICTHNVDKDACQGDSGGPAVEFIKGRGTLVGIVSYGVACADKYPGVFTKVSYFLNWIQNAILTN